MRRMDGAKEMCGTQGGLYGKLWKGQTSSWDTAERKEVSRGHSSPKGWRAEQNLSFTSFKIVWPTPQNSLCCPKDGLKTGNGQAKERRKQTRTTKLLEEILSKENLEKACTAVVRNKGASGIDGMKVDELKGYIG